MKKLYLCVALFLSWVTLCAAMPGNWQTQESKNFVVYYTNAAPEEIRQVLEKAQQHFDSIAQTFGLEQENLWNLDKRVKIYLFDSRKQYLLNTGQPIWSDSSSIQRLRVIYSFTGAKNFTSAALPHEIGHILFKELIGFDNPASPVWLEEGVVSFFENRDKTKVTDYLRAAMEKGSLVKVPELSKLVMRSVNDETALDLFFAESSSVAEYLITQFGEDTFRRFLRSLKETADFEKSLDRVYNFRDPGALDKAWQAYLKKESVP